MATAAVIRPAISYNLSFVWLRGLWTRVRVFAGAAILFLAICIGTNTIMFSVVNALLLRPLLAANPENLVRLLEVHPSAFVT